MMSDAQANHFKLSFCMATYNRSELIAATLDSILSQITNECEIVISDNASTDGTDCVVSRYSDRFKNLSYFRQKENVGPDRNFDTAVQIARGEYCWLVPDDDLLKPGAVAAVLDAIKRDYSLVVANVELLDVTLSEVLLRRWIPLEENRTYSPGDSDRLFEELGAGLQCVGCVVIKRSIWIGRNREKYYDTYFMHLAVIFQSPLPGDVLVLAEPALSVRIGGQGWFNKWFEVIMINLPALRWSFMSEDRKSAALPTVLKPWRNLKLLWAARAYGFYSLTDYWRFILPRESSVSSNLASIVIAIFPGVIINTFLIHRLRNHFDENSYARLLLYTLVESRFNVRNWRMFRGFYR